jgi:sensor histidine kinase regulating citrate/malate metabolism
VTLGFRAKIFLASLGVAAAALVFVTVIVAYERRQDERSSIEMRLITQAQLIAELLSQNSSISSSQTSMTRRIVSRTDADARDA